MKFFLGTHLPQWLGRIDVPLFVSHRMLHKRRTFPRALGEWALDSGGFTEISMFGERRDDGSVGDLFAGGIISAIPDDKPTASMEVVKSLLEENRITFGPSLFSHTVRSTVQALVNYNGLLCWKEPPNAYISKASKEILESLELY